MNWTKVKAKLLATKTVWFPPAPVTKAKNATKPVRKSTKRPVVKKPKI